MDHPLFHADQSDRRPQNERPHDRHDDARGNADVDEKRKVSVGFFRLLLSQRFADDRGASGADHQAEYADDREDGKCHVHRREGDLTDEIGNEQAVYDPVNG